MKIMNSGTPSSKAVIYAIENYPTFFKSWGEGWDDYIQSGLQKLSEFAISLESQENEGNIITIISSIKRLVSNNRKLCREFNSIINGIIDSEGLKYLGLLQSITHQLEQLENTPKELKENEPEIASWVEQSIEGIIGDIVYRELEPDRYEYLSRFIMSQQILIEDGNNINSDLYKLSEEQLSLISYIKELANDEDICSLIQSQFFQSNIIEYEIPQYEKLGIFINSSKPLCIGFLYDLLYKRTIPIKMVIGIRSEIERSELAEDISIELLRRKKTDGIIGNNLPAEDTLLNEEQKALLYRRLIEEKLISSSTEQSHFNWAIGLIQHQPSDFFMIRWLKTLPDLKYFIKRYYGLNQGRKDQVPSGVNDVVPLLFCNRHGKPFTSYAKKSATEADEKTKTTIDNIFYSISQK